MVESCIGALGCAELGSGVNSASPLPATRRACRRASGSELWNEDPAALRSIALTMRFS